MRIDIQSFKTSLDYSCSYKARQGWLYISENYLGFHSLLLGVETKALVELKDVQELKKERSKGIFDDTLRIITKDKEEVNVGLRMTTQLLLADTQMYL
jgi:hypothetical protein